MSRTDWENATVSPELLDFYRRHIGIEYDCDGWITEATPDAIRHFSLGIGDDNPLYLDAAYAKASPYGSIIVPPTFPDVFSNLGFVSKDGFGRGPLPGLFGLWAGDRWECIEPVRAGDRLACKWSLVSLKERKSSFAQKGWEQVEQIRYFNQHGRHVATYQVVRFNYERTGARREGKYVGTKPYRYTDDELAAITKAYEQEAGHRRGATPRYWPDTKAGEELPSLVKGPLTLTQLIGFVLGWGSAYCATNRLGHEYAKRKPGNVLINREFNLPDNVEGAHWDIQLAQQSGFPWAYDFGCMRTAWLGHLLTDWIGDHGRIKRFEAQIRRPNIVGDTQWMHGRVKATRRVGTEGLVDIDLWAMSQRGEVTATGEATVVLPVR